MPGSADVAITGARIRTLDPALPVASAVAIADGRIVATGDDAEIRALRGPRTELIDGAGLVVVPGLVDSHVHPFEGADDTLGVDLSPARTPKEVQALLAAERERAGGGWVRGHTLDYDALGPLDAAAALVTEAVGGQPALVTFYDLHTALATPAALAAAGVDGPRAFADTSEVVCRDGAPTGELREASAIALVAAAAPAPSARERRARVEAVLARMNALGLTGAQTMDGTPATLDRCAELEADGALTLRLDVPFVVEPGTTAAEQAALVALRDRRGELWRAGMVKLFLDGVIETGTAWLDGPDGLGRATRSFWPVLDDYRAAIARFDQAGFRCATHAVGELAVRAALDAYRDAAAANGARPGRPHRIEHVETLLDDDVGRFAHEGVTVAQQPLHLRWGHRAEDPWRAGLGAARERRAFRLGDLARAGALPALGSDWPVASADPRLGMAWARLRRPPGRPQEPAFGAEQRLGAEQALLGYTVAPALAAGRGDAGRVRVGFLADLTAFAGDPVACDADELPELPVALTIVGGRVVHRAG